MNSNLQVTVRTVYGTDTVYPACNASLLLCRLIGRKTFTHADIRTLKELGYTFTVTIPESATENLLAG
jgi:hypothetical protein